jgi:5-formaminoimidazole-4-carboxamide-1-beta-D-ribofuranosyl 5'-monophosphate synthetase
VFINLVNVCQNDKVEIYLSYEALNTLNVDKFEEIIDENHVDILIQNILITEHVIDDNDKFVTIAPRKGFQPLGLF